MQGDDYPIGSSLRRARRGRGLTLRQVAESAGVTESFLSQVERDIASPSIATLRRIAVALGMSIGQVLDEAGPHGQLVRAADRRVVTYPGLHARDEFLTDGTNARLQVILSRIEPGGGTGAEAYAHESDEECLIVLEGRLTLWVGDETYALEAGDAIRYSSRVPHRNQNPGPGVARVLFVLTPPSF
ncbi:MAG TPA: XRE family transcriptional regulator [Candidatus Limnocylindria bacterium]|nr:XRE family transcriptional regulator [Candidatus Limnocylindria bacterium]